MTLKTYSPEDLKQILESHKKFLAGEPGGIRANLRSADLGGADLRIANLRSADLGGADLRIADLYGANLSGANLSGADLSTADLSTADLSNADLYGADLRNADLSGADLRNADLRSANLRSANLGGADLRSANLRSANLCGADLSGADLRNADLGGRSIVPKKGSFVAYKQVRGAILELEVTGPRVSSLVGRKCRAAEVRVLAALDLDGNPLVDARSEFVSKHDCGFKYRVGEVATAPDYNDDIRIECTTGIHFFLTFEEARDY